jgi:hypothetical protein
MPVDTETRAILAAALRYVVQKSDQGITVGLHFGGDTYGEARRTDDDIEAAVREAFDQVRRRLPPDDPAADPAPTARQGDA